MKRVGKPRPLCGGMGCGGTVLCVMSTDPLLRQAMMRRLAAGPPAGVRWWLCELLTHGQTAAGGAEEAYGSAKRRLPRRPTARRALS